MPRYLDDNGLLYFWQKIKLVFAPLASPALTGTPTAPTPTTGDSSTKLATTAFVAAAVAAQTSGVSGVKGNSESSYRTGNVNLTAANVGAAPTSHASSSDTYGKGTSSNYGHVKLSDSTSSTTAASSGGTAATPKAVKDALDAAKTYADGMSNQNAFSNVKVGSTTVTADTTTDTLELIAGSNVTLTPDATNDTVTIAATDTTYSNASSSAAGLMSATDKAKLDSISMTNGIIDSSSLPSFVDDVVEAYPRANETELGSTWLSLTSGGSALTPETGKIYVLMADSTSYDANSQFRWGGSTYVKLADGGMTAITNAEIDTIVAS